VTDYTAIGTAIKDTLWGDSWINNFPNIKVIESSQRESSLQGADSPFFKTNEVPFIVIKPIASKKKEVSGTVTGKVDSIPVEILFISGDADAKTSQNQHETLAYNIERILDNQNLSGLGFGISGFMAAMNSTTTRFKKGNIIYYSTKINFSIELDA